MVCEWLVPHFCEPFYSATSLDLRRKALKLWCCLTETNLGPRRQRDPTAARKIVFPEYSSQGIVLFKSAANLLEPILAGFRDLETVEQQWLLKRIARVAANVLHNQYVCFGVFALYRDPVLHNLVNGVVGVFASFGFQQIIEHPPTAISVWGCLRAISQARLNECDTGAATAITEAIECGIRSLCPQVVELSFQILQAITDFVVAVHDTQFAEEHHAELKASAIILLERLMNDKCKAKLSAYAPLIRQLLMINSELFPDMCQAVRRYETTDNSEALQAILGAFEAGLPEILAEPSDLELSRHLQAIHEWLAECGRTIVLTG
jgi:hypothetical protein